MIKRFEEDGRTWWYVTCDACGMETAREASKQDAVYAVRTAGWTAIYRYDLGKDYCPACAAKISDHIRMMRKEAR